MARPLQKRCGVKACWFLIPALGACTAQPDPPAKLEWPAHALSVSDLRTLVVVDPLGTIEQDGEPVPLPPDASTGSASALELPSAVAVAAGAEHACILSANQVWCWGDDTHGALGAHRACTPPSSQGGSPECRLKPDVMPTLPPIRAIAAGVDVTCAIADDFRVYCWGDDTLGALGGSVVPALDPPTPVMLPDGTPLLAASLQISESTVCAVDQSARGWCWGEAIGAQPALQPFTGVRDLAVGRDHGCAISDAGLQCWGDDRNGQAGDVAFAQRCGQGPCTIGPTTIPVTATRVVVGERHSCALGSDGSVACWGSNEVGQLGRTDAFLVGGVGVAMTGVTDLGAAFARTCALQADGTAWCWGEQRDH